MEIFSYNTDKFEQCIKIFIGIQHFLMYKKYDAVFTDIWGQKIFVIIKNFPFQSVNFK